MITLTFTNEEVLSLMNVPIIARKVIETAELSCGSIEYAGFKFSKTQVEEIKSIIKSVQHVFSPKISAIKRIREMTGITNGHCNMGLREAKDFLEQVIIPMTK